jgi:hypothetical protein
MVIEIEEADWISVSDEQSKHFTDELLSEISADHPLYQRVDRAIKRRFSQDDVLFSLVDGRYAIVHLTYSQNNADGWPKFNEFATLRELV